MHSLYCHKAATINMQESLKIFQGFDEFQCPFPSFFILPCLNVNLLRLLFCRDVSGLDVTPDKHILQKSRQNLLK